MFPHKNGSSVVWHGDHYTPSVRRRDGHVQHIFGGKRHREITGKQSFISSSHIVNVKTGPEISPEQDM